MYTIIKNANIELDDLGKYKTLIKYAGIFLYIDIEYVVMYDDAADKYSLCIKDKNMDYILICTNNKFTTLEECEDYLIEFYYNALYDLIKCDRSIRFD